MQDYVSIMSLPLYFVLHMSSSALVFLVYNKWSHECFCDLPQSTSLSTKTLHTSPSFPLHLTFTLLSTSSSPSPLNLTFTLLSTSLSLSSCPPHLHPSLHLTFTLLSTSPSPSSPPYLTLFLSTSPHALPLHLTFPSSSPPHLPLFLSTSPSLSTSPHLHPPLHLTSSSSPPHLHPPLHLTFTLLSTSPSPSSPPHLSHCQAKVSPSDS